MITKLNFELDVPLWKLTVGEFLELITGVDFSPTTVMDTTAPGKNYVYGLAGLAQLFGCSKTTANRIKQSGKINGAITQLGNKIVVDADKALELAGK